MPATWLRESGPKLARRLSKKAFMVHLSGVGNSGDDGRQKHEGRHKGGQAEKAAHHDLLDFGEAPDE